MVYKHIQLLIVKYCGRYPCIKAQFGMSLMSHSKSFLFIISLAMPRETTEGLQKIQFLCTLIKTKYSILFLAQSFQKWIYESCYTIMTIKYVKTLWRELWRHVGRTGSGHDGWRMTGWLLGKRGSKWGVWMRIYSIRAQGVLHSLVFCSFSYRRPKYVEVKT